MKITKGTSTPPTAGEKPNLGKICKCLWQYIKPEKALFAETLALTLVLTALGLVIPKGISEAIDLIAGIHDGTPLRELGMLLGLILVLYLAQCLLSYREDIQSSKLFLHIAQRMRGDYFNKITTVPIGYLDANRHGDLISRGSNDIETVVKLVSEVLFKILSSAVLFVGCLVVMAFISWQLTGICLLAAAVTFLVTKLLSHFIRHHAIAQQRQLGVMNGFLEDSISNIKSIKLFNRQVYLGEKFSRLSGKLKKTSIATLTWMSAVAPVNNLIGNINFVLIAVIGGYLTLSGDSGLTVATMVLFVLYVREYTEALNNLSEVASEVQPAIAAASRYFEVLSAPEEDISHKEEKISDGSLTISDLHFSYVQNVPVLSGVDLQIESGQNVAIVGPSGCGKTTLIQLLLRLYQPDRGKICIGGKDIREYSLSELRKNVIAIMQDDIVFDEPLSYNIFYGTAGKDNPALEEIAKKSGVDTQAIPDEYALSRGQMQKICVMRAFSAEAKIIILDESLSLVDQLTYDELFRSLRETFPTATFITITHQLSCLKKCDNILFLSHGKILEQGTFEALTQQTGAFYEMLKREN